MAVCRVGESGSGGDAVTRPDFRRYDEMITLLYEAEMVLCGVRLVRYGSPGDRQHTASMPNNSCSSGDCATPPEVSDNTAIGYAGAAA